MSQRVLAAMRLIEAFVALISGRKVPVSWGDHASLDSKGTIHLPKPKVGDAPEVALLTRLAVHESGHLIHTEEGFADRLDQAEMVVFNALEDPRMEREQCSVFPGAGLILERGLDEMLEGIERDLEANGAQPGRALALDLLIRGFVQTAPHGPLVQRAPRLLELLAPGVSPREREAIDEAVSAIPMAANSLEAENIAKALVARLREEQDEPPGQASSDEKPETAPPDDVNDGEAGAAPDSVESEGSSAPETDGEAADGAPAGGDVESHDEGVGDEGMPGDRQDDASNSGAGSNTRQQADAPEPDEVGDDHQAGEDDHGAADNASAASSEANAASPNASAESGAGPGSSSSSADAPAGDPARAAPGGQVSDLEQVTPFDLGSLLRGAITERYGESAGEAVEPLTPAPVSDAEIERVRAAIIAAGGEADLEQLLESTLIALAAFDGNEPATSENTQSGGASMVPGTAETQLEPIGLETRLGGVQGRLVGVLQREFQDRKRRPVQAAFAGGRIISQRHWRLARLGDTRVFAKKRLVNGMDAAATLLMDASASMAERLQAALEVTLAFSLALQRLGVRTKVARFPATDVDVVETLQEFGEAPRRCAQRCQGLTTPPWTPVGAATAIELEHLLHQNRLKNFLAIVTDDEPGDPETYLAALAHAREQDVQVVGVGIGCDISNWIPESVSINSANELPDALSALFRSNLVAKLAA